MNPHKQKWAVLVFVVASILVLGACKKKVVSPPTPPPPPPPAPTVSLTASPSVIERGQSSTLTWETQNASDITIDSIGAVAASGSHTVTPGESTTYRLVAKGSGGSETATARVTVNAPPPPTPIAAASPNLEQLFSANIRNVFFDFDKHDVRADQQGAIRENAKFLIEYSNIKFLVEGHCDERGSVEYNLALGDSRAHAVKQALVEAAVSPDRIATVSYGKERPFCTEQNQACWQENRQGHIAYQK